MILLRKNTLPYFPKNVGRLLTWCVPLPVANILPPQ